MCVGDEALHMLDQQQHLEQPDGEVLDIGVQHAFGLKNTVVRRALDSIVNAVVQPIERNELAHSRVLGLLQRGADDGQHGTFPHGGVASIEHVVLAHTAQCGLEQFELVVHQWIAGLEILFGESF